jgi:sphingolipid delta-4 desaturase
MGKGGNAGAKTAAAPADLTKGLSDNSAEQDAGSQLEKERQVKLDNSKAFYWSASDEPHASRRKAIVAAHPEIKKLFGPCHLTKYKVAASVAVQIASIHILQGAPLWLWAFCCYTLSGSINHMMTLAMHELSHNLGHKNKTVNRFLAIFANLPMGIPAAASFKRYHLEHHRFQGEDIIDVDIPTMLETQLFTNAFTKTIWCLMQPLFYSLRPLFVNPKDPRMWEFINIGFTVTFDSLIWYFYGFSGLFYLVIGTLLGMGIHPVAGHFIAEHYVMNKDQETYSYYGPLNWFTFNVGYHNEHHDFPFISGTNLPKVRAIAPEFYDNIPHYHSWSKVIWDYIFDAEVGPHARTKRVTMLEEERLELKARGGLVI